jgi:hypothetical protein
MLDFGLCRRCVVVAQRNKTPTIVESADYSYSYQNPREAYATVLHAR